MSSLFLGEDALREHHLIPAEECVNPGDTAWVCISMVLVLGMVPALALFEGGLLRAKNTLSIITQIFCGLALMQFMWHMVGFSLTLGPSQGGIIGDFSFAWYRHLDLNCLSHYAPTVPGTVYALFMSMFAAISPLLITGAFAERIKFKAAMLFMALWELLVYYPLAHWIWGHGGWLKKFGVIDFAGGIVIHTSAGVSALTVSLLLGKRRDFARHHGEPHPHNVPLATVGTALLMVGWYGFNGGSALAASTVAGTAVASTTVAAAVSSLVWVFLSLLHNRQIYTVAVLNGAIAGLAGITPVSGYVESYWATVISVFIALGSFYGVWLFKGKLKVDDALDVTSVHGIPGVIGSLAIGFVANKRLNPSGANGWFHGHPSLLYKQVVGIVVAAAWAAFWSVAIVGIIKMWGLIGNTKVARKHMPSMMRMRLRAHHEEEIQGLDILDKGGHGHRAYNNLYAEDEEYNEWEPVDQSEVVHLINGAQDASYSEIYD